MLRFNEVSSDTETSSARESEVRDFCLKRKGIGWNSLSRFTNFRQRAYANLITYIIK